MLLPLLGLVKTSVQVMADTLVPPVFPPSFSTPLFELRMSWRKTCIGYPVGSETCYFFSGILSLVGLTDFKLFWVGK